MLRIGTRGSALALAQSGDVKRWLGEAGFPAELVVIKTLGDQRQDRPFAEVGAPGIFVREIEVALLEGRIDLAVHSYKDLTSLNPEGLIIDAIPERLDSADHLLIRPSALDRSRGLLPLREGSTVGTASARRGALLRDLRPDLEAKMLRGNVPSRVNQLKKGAFDAILLAGAGLARLSRAGLDALLGADLIVERLDPHRFVPAPSQGALALQARLDDAPTRRALAQVHDHAAARRVACERALLTLVEGGCQLPFGAYCDEAEPGELRLTAFLEVEGEGQRAQVRGDDPQALAEAAWAQLKTWEGERPWSGA